MKTTGISAVKRDLRRVADDGKAAVLRRFFKTGKGQYGEGDKFLGVAVPEIRRIAKGHLGLALPQIEQLLHSPYHEDRLTALIIMTYIYPKADERLKERIFRIYLKNLKWINNWDLIDLSAPNIIGAHLADRPRGLLLKMAKSKHLWTRRAAVLSTFEFIRRGDSDMTYDLALMLIADNHDLIHKAVGWMLREAGKRQSEARLREFLDHYASRMPRTMLRYAIERLDEPARNKYLKAS